MKKTKILTLYVRYGDERYQDALERLKSFYQSFSSVLENDLCIIENQEGLMKQDVVIEKDHTLMKGDNSYFEFSAWDKALKHYEDRLHEYDLVHFVTSAFLMTYKGYLDHFHPEHFSNVVKRGFCLGHV